MKRYQIMHQKDGEKVQYDTLIPMTSTYTTDQFLADKGIDPTDVKVINLSDLHGGHPGAHKMRFISDDNDGEDVQIKMIIDEEGNKKVTKTVNGKEVEMSEAEMQDLEKKHGEKVVTA